VPCAFLHKRNAYAYFVGRVLHKKGQLAVISGADVQNRTPESRRSDGGRRLVRMYTDC